jgi:FKBP-type peptidyl-prolyl cis-trans isomerase
MKRYFLLIVAVVGCIALATCKKGNDPATQAAVDDAKIQAYFEANGIFDAKKDASGLYYEIVTYGPGANNTATFPVGATDTTVKVAYTGKYLNGQTFSPLETNTFDTNTFISGFAIGIKYINIGGRIRLFVPSGLAYGTAGTGSGGIPPNACVIFTIDLLGFY